MLEENRGVAQRRPRLVRVTGRNYGRCGLTAASSAPEFSEKRSIAEPRPKLSRARRSRNRYKLRAFYQGVQCGMGPPGITEAASGAEFFRMDAGDTDDEEVAGDEEEFQDADECAAVAQTGAVWAGTSSHLANEDRSPLLAGIAVAQTDVGNWTGYENRCYKVCWGKRRKAHDVSNNGSVANAADCNNADNLCPEMDTTLRRHAVPTATQPNLGGGDLAVGSEVSTSPLDSFTPLEVEGVEAELLMDKLDYALQVALAVENAGHGRILNLRSFTSAIGHTMDVTRQQAAVLIKALVTIGGLYYVEDALGEELLAVTEEARRIHTAGLYSVTGELLDSMDRGSGSAG